MAMNPDALYQEQILALARLARSHPRLDSAAHSGTANNPVCGDRIVVDLETDGGGRITAMGARVDGCALCEAATGLMIEALQGRRLGETGGLHRDIAGWLAGGRDDTVVEGQLSFTPVKEFPARHRCVTLPFEALADAVPAE